MTESSMFSAMMLVGVPPEDAEVIVDFFRRLDTAMGELAKAPHWPTDILKPQEVIPGLLRVSTALRDVQEDEYAPHPRFLIDGAVRHYKWGALLRLMYPGVQLEPLLVYGNIQGHPDAVCPEPTGLVIEVKTVGVGRWKQAQRKALSHHVEQLQAYLFMAGRKKGLLVYENRDTLDVWCHVIHLPDDSYPRVFQPKQEEKEEANGDGSLQRDGRD